MAADQERPEVLHQRLVTASAAFSLRGLVKSAQWYRHHRREQVHASHVITVQGCRLGQRAGH
jgi:hypothetical protein